jgi:MFS family permease
MSAEATQHLVPGDEAGRYPRESYAWFVVAILIVTAILSYTDRQVISLLVDPIRRDLHISDTQISLLLGTAFALIYGVAGLPLGYLADRISRRNLIAAGLVVWSLATMACALAQSFGQIFAARVFVGLGEAALSPAAIALISDYFPPSRRGLAVGFFLSGIAMGSGVAIAIGGLVLQVVGATPTVAPVLGPLAPWRMVFLLIGLPGLVWSAAIFLIKEPVRRHSAATGGEGSLPGSRSFSWPRAAPLFAIVALASLVDNAVGAWAPSLLIREFHKTAGDVGLLLGLLLTAGFGGGVLIGGFLADRAGTVRRRLTVSLAPALAIPVAAVLLLAPVYGVVLWAIPLYFLLSGIVTALGFASILQLVPSESRGLAMSVSFFLNVALGAGVGPTAVALAGAHVFGLAAGLGPPIVLTVVLGYAMAIVAMAVARSGRG